MHLTAGVVFVELEVVSFNAMCENRRVPRRSQLRLFSQMFTCFLKDFGLKHPFSTWRSKNVARAYIDSGEEPSFLVSHTKMEKNAYFFRIRFDLSHFIELTNRSGSLVIMSDLW